MSKYLIDMCLNGINNIMYFYIFMVKHVAGKGVDFVQNNGNGKKKKKTLRAIE